jgi:hypothetical protein
MRGASKAVTPREGLRLHQNVGFEKYRSLSDLPEAIIAWERSVKVEVLCCLQPVFSRGSPVLRLMSLFLPTVIPSWRFFQTVAPSPRIEYRLITGEQAGDWHEDRPRPAHLSFGQMLRRMLWNPDWNEQLYLVSCSERLIEAPSQHSLDEINTRVARLLPHGPQLLQIRLVFVSREGAQIVKLVEYESTPVPLASLQKAAE